MPVLFALKVHGCYGSVKQLSAKLTDQLVNSNNLINKLYLMRTLILILIFIPITSLAQKTEIFLKLTDARNQPVKGEALLKGYERAIQATTLNNSSSKNNTQVGFTMSVSGASADLKRAMTNSELLPKGEVTVLMSTGEPVPSVSDTIKMESISVLSCREVMSCNNAMNTTVTLQATRIGWTYYTGRAGMVSVSRKYGWDAGTSAEWTNF